MSGECQREMTLDEWVERLPEIHSARKEYAALKGAVEKLTAHNPSSPKLFSEYKEELMSLLRENDNEVLKTWWMAGAKAMHSIFIKQLRAR